MIDIDRFKDYFLSADSASISNQIQDLIFHDCFYRTFNYGIGLEVERNHYSPSFFLEQYQDNAFLSKAASLRKFFEFPARSKGKKTYSILTVVEAIEENHSSFTLSNYMALPIDDPNPQRFTGRMRELLNEHRITVFKTLSDNPRPTPDDTISLDLLHQIRHTIEGAKKRLDYHLNKFWLHCSDPVTRNDPCLGTRLLTLNYLQYLLKTAVWSINTMSKYVDLFVLCEMPTFTFDPLIGCDVIFSPSTLRKCSHFFHKRYALYKSWSRLYSQDEFLYTNLRRHGP